MYSSLCFETSVYLNYYVLLIEFLSEIKYSVDTKYTSFRGFFQYKRVRFKALRRLYPARIKDLFDNFVIAQVDKFKITEIARF